MPRPVPDAIEHAAPPARIGYRPIRDYGLIGDCHGAALVSRDGSIDWACLERFDRDPVLCAMLDAKQGGYLAVQLAIEGDVSRAYLPGTNILRSRFETGRGALTLTDFMPVGRKPGSGVHDYVSLDAPHWIVRIARCESGRVPVRVSYRPSVDFARRPVDFEVAQSAVLTRDGPCLYADVPFQRMENSADARADLRAGDALHLVLSSRPLARAPAPEALERLLDVTRAFWEEWTGYCRYDGVHKDAVLRSALVLKLLTYSPTGALIAAPTTSLPEEIGGQRNWDYRYCWLRDASFTLYALSALGYSGEARDFAGFLDRQCKAGNDRLQVMYGIGHEMNLTERELLHLEGYCGSRPVRTGNAAFDQRQLDTTGELLDWAHLYKEMGGRFDKRTRRFLSSVADYAAEHWSEPGNGIWEIRTAPRHEVFSKIMCWAALDRALSMFGPNEVWKRAREEIHAAVLEKGIDRETGALRQTFEHGGTDVALLLTPQVGFPISQQTLVATIRRVEEHLQRGDYFYRYRTPDGLPGTEGAFNIAGFWMVEAKLHAGLAEEASELFDRIACCPNDLGLYSEEIDPDTGEFLGNFPQAYTHLALILCAATLHLQREKSTESLRGTHADRAHQHVRAIGGLRAMGSSFAKSRWTRRIRSSRGSILRESAYG